MSVSRVKGFADMFSPESDAYTCMEQCARTVFGRYGFIELRTPILEYTELFKRSIGADTDVVSKEMFTFNDRKGRSLTLRPEATAGVMRAFIEDALHTREQVSRLFTFGPMFRYERPQKGRMRQFHQINCECLGSDAPAADAELISMLMCFLSELDIKDLTLKLNSLGCAECRPKFRAALTSYLQGVDQQNLCPDCVRRVAVNPLRVLDCKQSGCRAITVLAPSFLGCLCAECNAHFDAVQALLRADSLSFELDHRLVRGLDYYCRTTFEVVSGTIGAQSAVAGGGRYDGLVRSLGGPDIPGIGFACGMERLSLLMQPGTPVRLDFYLLAMSADAGSSSFVEGYAFILAQLFRNNGLSGVFDFGSGGFKGRMRQASKSGAKYCLIVGPDEVDNDTVTVKSMDSGEQVVIPQGLAVQYLRTGAVHDRKLHSTRT